MKVIKTKYFPFGRYTTINLFGILFTKLDTLSQHVLNHEAIHTAQMKEMAYIFFYIWYAIEWLVLLVKYRETFWAYYQLSFELEAHTNMHDTDYINERKRYAWTKYLNK